MKNWRQFYLKLFTFSFIIFLCLFPHLALHTVCCLVENLRRNTMYVMLQTNLCDLSNKDTNCQILLCQYIFWFIRNWVSNKGVFYLPHKFHHRPKNKKTKIWERECRKFCTQRYVRQFFHSNTNYQLLTSVSKKSQLISEGLMVRSTGKIIMAFISNTALLVFIAQRSTLIILFTLDEPQTGTLFDTLR